ncbi:alpha/beta hydrolase fold-domain-containing protein [Mycena maculata]|uniref:Alpha/beta hydrolase fold-domain-containing protein n=1 Tax=Mycena maculata TaxID=230809 RepID=A0AAD7J715_9AGAR|nr:alpha/beta hydrolase fold-domain-containing protein [Mycena maculata]
MLDDTRSLQSNMAQQIHQPIHPSMVPRLDPEYVQFHNESLARLVPPHTVPWSPELRNVPAVPGGSTPLVVGATEDIALSHTKFRAFSPEGDSPANGWPCFIFFHGGGWTFGNINSENAFATNMCKRWYFQGHRLPPLIHCPGANCVVLSVDYRLAPEHRYPTAVEDAVESLDWVIQNGKSKLNIDTARISVGGSSSGGNLAAILTLKAAEASPPIPLIFQLLIVPVTDNTASVDNLWAENALTPWLSPARMLWFRDNYLPNKEDYTKWDASPYFAPDVLLAKVPKTWIAVCEADILRDEGIEYGKKLSALGVEVEVELYKGAPHPIMAMDGVLKIGAKMVLDAATALAKGLEMQ